MFRFYYTGSKFIDISYSQWTERDPQHIQDAVGVFLEGAGNMVHSAVLSKSENVSEDRAVGITFLSFLNKTNILKSFGRLLVE